MSEIRIEAYDPNNVAHFRGIHELFDLQAKDIIRQLDEAFPREPGQKARLVKGPITQKIKKEREAAQHIIDRAIRSKHARTAFAHVAIQQDGTRDGRVVGYIISHQVLEEPLRRHVRAIKSRFDQLKGLVEEEFKKSVLSGEHSYVHPQYRGENIGTRLFDIHEAEAAKRGYVVRASHVTGPNGRANEFLRRRGYRVVAVRADGVRILAKALKPARRK